MAHRTPSNMKGSGMANLADSDMATFAESDMGESGNEGDSDNDLEYQSLKSLGCCAIL